MKYNRRHVVYARWFYANSTHTQYVSVNFSKNGETMFCPLQSFDETLNTGRHVCISEISSPKCSQIWALCSICVCASSVEREWVGHGPWASIALFELHWVKINHSIGSGMPCGKCLLKSFMHTMANELISLWICKQKGEAIECNYFWQIWIMDVMMSKQRTSWFCSFDS